MTKINLLNENSNIRPNVRKAIQKQVVGMLTENLPAIVDKTEKKNLVTIEVGEVADCPVVEMNGKPIYVTLEVGVTIVHPNDKVKGDKEKPVQATKETVPTLFPSE